MRNNTKVDRKPKGEHQKRVKQAIQGLFTGSQTRCNIGSTGFAWSTMGNVQIYKGTNHSGELIRVI